jgi:hypothetical protein
MSDTPDKVDHGGQACPGGFDAHTEHMAINGDCPWCESYDRSKWLTDEEAARAMGDWPRYPEITVELIGTDGNAFAVLGRVRRALSAADVPHDEIRAFINEATAGDYEHLLATVMRWVNVE